MIYDPLDRPVYNFDDEDQEFDLAIKRDDLIDSI